MKIQFLGTGAADWNIEERNDSEFFRRFSSALINNDLLIDPGPHIFDFCQKQGNSELYKEVTDVLITHSHGDHLSSDALEELLKTANPRVWCNKATSHKVRTITDKYTVMDLSDTYIVGNYSVTPLLANHSVISMGEEAMMFAVSDGEKNLFYGCDSAWLPFESWKLMGMIGFDLAVLDVTVGDIKGDHRIFEHNNIEMAKMMVETMRSRNVLHSGGIAVGSHFSKFAHTDHRSLTKRLAEFGMIAAYDGLIIDF